MTMLVTNNTNASIQTGAVVATAPVLFTFSGTLGELKRSPNITIFARSDTADYAPAYSQSGFGRFIVQLANADDYYALIENFGGSVDLAAVVAP